MHNICIPFPKNSFSKVPTDATSIDEINKRFYPIFYPLETPIFNSSRIFSHRNDEPVVEVLEKTRNGLNKYQNAMGSH